LVSVPLFGCTRRSQNPGTDSPTFEFVSFALSSIGL
jgi:hypothetical protein